MDIRKQRVGQAYVSVYTVKGSTGKLSQRK